MTTTVQCRLGEKENVLPNRLTKAAASLIVGGRTFETASGNYGGAIATGLEYPSLTTGEWSEK